MDDSALVRRGLSNLLRGIESVEIVGEAANVANAIQAVEELSPDVVVLDFNMPDGSGLDVLVGIKPTKQGPTVIIFTSHTSQQLRDKCIEAGAHHFFNKTTGFRDLVELFKNLGKRRGASASCNGDSETQTVNA